MSELVEFKATESKLEPENYPDFDNTGPNRFELPEIRCLILGDDTGLVFTSQVGGFACLHPGYRGRVFSSEALDAALSKVETYIYKRFSGWCVPKSHFFHEEGGGRCLEIEDANAIDAILAKHGLGTVTVDRSKLEESAEAWVFGLWDGKPCVLTTYNSD